MQHAFNRSESCHNSSPTPILQSGSLITSSFISPKGTVLGLNVFKPITQTYMPKEHFQILHKFRSSQILFSKEENSFTLEDPLQWD